MAQEADSVASPSRRFNWCASTTSPNPVSSPKSNAPQLVRDIERQSRAGMYRESSVGPRPQLTHSRIDLFVRPLPSSLVGAAGVRSEPDERQVRAHHLREVQGPLLGGFLEVRPPDRCHSVQVQPSGTNPAGDFRPDGGGEIASRDVGRVENVRVHADVTDEEPWIEREPSELQARIPAALLGDDLLGRGVGDTSTASRAPAGTMR